MFFNDAHVYAQVICLVITSQSLVILSH